MLSRNKREGQYLGHCDGHAIRKITKRKWQVNSFVANAFRFGKVVQKHKLRITRMGEQGAR